jgi:hypothetical protein
MAAPLTRRPQLLAQLTTTLKTIPTRVLRTEEAATTDAQRQSQAGFTRTNEAIDAINALKQVPFGAGQFLTVPDGKGGRNELITFAAPGTYFLPHTLGRPVEGFIVVDTQTSGNHRTHRVAQSRSADEKTIELHVQAACALKIWVW